MFGIKSITPAGFSDAYTYARMSELVYDAENPMHWPAGWTLLHTKPALPLDSRRDI